MNRIKGPTPYLLLLSGRIATNIGDSFLYMITIWYIKSSGCSPIVMSIAFLVVSVIDAIAFLFGPIIDKTTPKQNLFIASLVQTLTIVVLLFFLFLCNDGDRTINVALLISLCLVYICSSFIYPAGEKLIPLLVEQNKLLHVNGMFNISEKVLDVFFNAIATLLISFFYVNHLVIVVLIVFLISTYLYRIIARHFTSEHLARTVPSVQKPYKNKRLLSISHFVSDLRCGIYEIIRNRIILFLFLPLSVLNFFYGIAMVSLPYVTTSFIINEAYGYGILLLCSSLGGILGAVLIDRIQESIKSPIKYTFIFLFVAGLSWLLFAISLPINYLIALLCILISNASINMMNVMFVTLVQIHVGQSLLGRVSTITESMVAIMIPAGNFIGGLLLDCVSPLVHQFSYGVALILCALSFVLLRKIIAKRSNTK